MITGLELTNYRRFERFTVTGLSRVTLMTGSNNSGKTSLLDAAEVLAWGGAPWALLRALSRRREYDLFERGEDEVALRQLQVGRLFHRFRHDPGVEMSLRAHNGDAVALSCIVRAWDGQPGDLDDPNWVKSATERELQSSFPTAGPSTLEFRVSATGRSHRLTIDSTGVGTPKIASFFRRAVEGENPVYLGTGGLPPSYLGRAWEQVVRQREDEHVARLLRIVVPDLTRVQATPSEQTRGSGGNLLVRVSSMREDIPLGTFGDGLTHLLHLGCALFQARGSVLLVDEIDTGLHHTVMKRMWLALIETARRIDAQIIATTHSDDCINSLAWAVSERPDLAPDVCLHRISADATESQRFDSQNLTVAVGGGIDLR